MLGWFSSLCAEAVIWTWGRYRLRSLFLAVVGFLEVYYNIFAVNIKRFDELDVVY